ncbi:hypothetical protein KIN20_030547 [Parelaphostrongylus tenuis]|uniref:Uncharacterized protein n=1 Tax=Parelaphostrongylus tenuis TaxID=148309 RepID=A0AAD5R3X7_PARTN|nr:hypothetical protein KIN20_030547 [Parelaphostrongylus tenuis]
MKRLVSIHRHGQDGHGEEGGEEGFFSPLLSKRDKPLLLQNIAKRKEASDGDQTLSSTPSQPVHPRGGQESPEGNPTCSQKPQATIIWALSRLLYVLCSRAGRVKHLPSEQGGPSGKGTSNSAMSVPRATSGRKSTGQMPESPPEYPDYDSVMALYHTCHSMLMADLSGRAPNEAPEAE